MIMGILDTIFKNQKVEETKPIFTINENEIPLFIIVLNIEKTAQNFFGCIMHNKKKKTFSGGYRVRNERTLDKNIHKISDKKGNLNIKWNEDKVKLFKNGLRYAFKGVAKAAGVKKVTEFEFKRDAKTEDILKELRFSDMFEMKEVIKKKK